MYDYTQLRLDPLGRESTDERLRSLLGDSAEFAPLKRLIIEKTMTARVIAPKNTIAAASRPELAT